MLAHAGACWGSRNAKSALIVASMMLALAQGVTPQAACDLPNARASAIRNSKVKQCKEKRMVPKEKLADPASCGRVYRVRAQHLLRRPHRENLDEASDTA